VIDINVTYRPKLEDTFERLFQKKTTLSKARPLPSIVVNNIKESLSIEWNYNSNSIEGNTLTLRETQMVLQDGVTVKGKSLREYFEISNHETALNYLYKLVDKQENISSKNILGVHGYVLRSIEDEYAGRIRNASVRIAGANFIPPNSLKVPDLLDELVDFVNSNPLDLNVIELATVFHHQFVHIHPFFDGNGRTVRLIMNLLLLRAGFTPAIILKNDRKKYFDALNSANNGNYFKLMLLMAQAVERTLNIYLSAIPNSNYGYEVISNLVKEEQLPYGQDYISLLARQGKIDAYKEGRNWFTSKKAVEDYFNKKRKK